MSAAFFAFFEERRLPANELRLPQAASLEDFAALKARSTNGRLQNALLCDTVTIEVMR